jgi:hypothetical protein
LLLPAVYFGQQSISSLFYRLMANRPTPGVVANSLIRYVLTQAGLAAGGLTPPQWQQTLDFFGNCCTYTGQPLTSAEKEHAVPMNRTQGGLHVYGNVLPATAEANREKGGLRYDVFLRSKGPKFKSLEKLSDAERAERIKRIEDFIKSARTSDNLLATAHPQLLAFYEQQYKAAKLLCANAVEQMYALLEQLHVAEVAANEADDALLDLPSDEQFTLEEQDTDTLPELYAAIQARGSQTGVGAYAQEVFRQLFADGRIAACLPNLLYREDSFVWLKLSFPALATQRTSENIDRYYATPLRHAGTDYYLCNHWYPKNRDYLDAWLTEQIAGR